MLMVFIGLGRLIAEGKDPSSVLPPSAPGRTNRDRSRVDDADTTSARPTERRAVMQTLIPDRPLPPIPSPTTTTINNKEGPLREAQLRHNEHPSSRRASYSSSFFFFLPHGPTDADDVIVIA